MDLSLLTKISDYEWQLEPKGAMRVPGILYGDESLLKEMEEKVLDQVSHVAALPGIVKASFAMPDAHWGYGFPIGGVAAFEKDGGVVSAGGVGFDISCGVRTILTGLTKDDIHPVAHKLADTLFHTIPAGVGSRGFLHLSVHDLNRLLENGAKWAVHNGYGTNDDIIHTENNGYAPDARPDAVSIHAKQRQQNEMGTLGSGNHYLEVQEVTHIFDEKIATAFGLKLGDIVISIHCGSRGLGHQIATDYTRKMVEAAQSYGITLTDRDLACAPLSSQIGQEYLGAMRAAINCALANRQILTHIL